MVQSENKMQVKLTDVTPTSYNAARKEARGSPLFSYLNGVQVVAGSNPATPTSEHKSRWLLAIVDQA